MQPLGGLPDRGRHAARLHEVRPHDPLTFALVPLLLLAIAVAASYLPARRATRIDPIAALRSE